MSIIIRMYKPYSNWLLIIVTGAYFMNLQVH